MRTLEALHQRGIRVFIIKDAPNPNFDVPTTLAKSLFYDVNLDMRPTKESFMNENRTANELFETDEVQKYATVIDIAQYFCKSDRCELSLDNHPFYFDRGHLSNFGSLQLSPLLEELFVVKQTSGSNQAKSLTNCRITCDGAP